jgi:hypothetical protein
MPPELPVDALASFAADLVGRDPRRYTNGEDFFLNCCVYPEIFSPEMAELWMKQISEKLPKDADLHNMVYLEDEDGTLVFFLVPEEYSHCVGERMMLVLLQEKKKHRLQ